MTLIPIDWRFAPATYSMNLGCITWTNLSDVYIDSSDERKESLTAVISRVALALQVENNNIIDHKI